MEVKDLVKAMQDKFKRINPSVQQDSDTGDFLVDITLTVSAKFNEKWLHSEEYRDYYIKVQVLDMLENLQNQINDAKKG